MRRRAAEIIVMAGLFSVMSIAAVPPDAEVHAGETSSASERALRGRVEQLYTAMKEGDWAEVESCLTDDSKQIFRREPRRGIAGFEIQSIKLDPDGQSATVTARIPVSSVTSPEPIPVQKTTRWLLINGVWYLELPKPDPKVLQSMYTAPPKSAFSARPLALSKDLKFQSTWSGLGQVREDQPKVARFPFQNVSTHVVKLTDVQVGCDCLRLKTQQKEFKAGESGALEFAFDPSSMLVRATTAFTQTILLKTEPDDAYVKLTVSALLVPGKGNSTQP